MAALQRFSPIGSGVLVATSRRYATTTTVLLDGSGGAIVVDPNWDPDELAAIPADLAALGVTCVGGVATHEHYDHVMWHPGLGDVPRWASERTAHDLAQQRDRLLAPLVDYLTPDLIAIAGRVDALSTQTLPWSGPATRVVIHDAHAPGHLALLVEEPGVLVVGDMLSDVELPMPDPQDVSLETYLSGLEALAPVVAQSSLMIPGHGTPTRAPLERLEADVRYLDDLLSGRTPDDPRIADPENADLHLANLRRAGR